MTISEEHVLLKRDKIIEIRRFGSSKDFLSRRKYVISLVCSLFYFIRDIWRTIIPYNVIADDCE